MQGKRDGRQPSECFRILVMEESREEKALLLGLKPPPDFNLCAGQGHCLDLLQFSRLIA